MNELINLLVDEKFFENEGTVHTFLRKHHAHELTPKGRLWQLAQGWLNLRFPGLDISHFEWEDGSLVLDWVTRNDAFVVALLDNGIEEMGSVLGTTSNILYSIEFIHSRCILDLPKRDKWTNKCVRKHIESSPTVNLHTHEINYIRDIERPGDEEVGDEPFHQGNFQSSKHNLVVKLRPLDGIIHTN